MSLNRDQIYETTVSLFIAWKNMGLAAKRTKILPACGMSWHWRIEKQTHYERERERKWKKSPQDKRQQPQIKLRCKRNTERISNGKREVHLATSQLIRHFKFL